MLSKEWKYMKMYSPIIGQPGHSAHRLVLKTEKPSKSYLAR
jgi:hypothetical protein